MNEVRKWAIEELRRMVLKALAGHEAEVWLFGSCARDEVRQHSDIDIAILPHDQSSADVLAELAAEIEESKIPYIVDLVNLRRADAALIDAVRREGIPWRK